jgi:hypothetical protein
MKGADEEDRNGGHFLPVRPSADISRDRHLADVELKAAHHSTERGNQRINLDEVELKRLRPHRAIFERLIISLRPRHGRKHRSRHRLTPDNLVALCSDSREELRSLARETPVQVKICR